MACAAAAHAIATKSCLDDRQLAPGGAKVLLLGMQLPPNYGKRYTDAFAEVYSNWQREKHPAGTVFPRRRGRASGADAGRWHAPGGRGPGKLLENVWPTLKPLL
jgi:acyl-CoA thioesterase-1